MGMFCPLRIFQIMVAYFAQTGPSTPKVPKSNENVERNEIEKDEMKEKETIEIGEKVQEFERMQENEQGKYSKSKIFFWKMNLSLADSIIL